MAIIRLQIDTPKEIKEAGKQMGRLAKRLDKAEAGLKAVKKIKAKPTPRPKVEKKKNPLRKAVKRQVAPDNNPSPELTVLVRELRGIKAGISNLPHSEHIGGNV